jgi:hypothetical protein
MFISISIDIDCIFLNSYNRAKQRYLQKKDDQLHPVQHLISAAEAGALVRTLTFIFSKRINIIGSLLFFIVQSKIQILLLNCQNVTGPFIVCITFMIFLTTDIGSVIYSLIFYFII